MKIISFFCIGFFLFLGNNSISQESSETGTSVHLMFRVLGWQPNEAIGIKYPANVSKEQIQADMAALAQAYGWTYAEKSLEIRYKNGRKVAWQEGALSEKQRLARNFVLNLQVLHEQFHNADSIVIDIIGQNGFVYQDSFAAVEVANNNINMNEQKWHRQFGFRKIWSGELSFVGLSTYRIRYMLHPVQFSGNMNLPVLKANFSFSKVWFLKVVPLLLFLIVVPSVTVHLLLKRDVRFNERGKIILKPLQLLIIYIELHIIISSVFYLGYIYLCIAVTQSVFLGFLLSVVPVSVTCLLIFLRVLHHHEKASRGTTWSFRENVLTNLRMMVLGAPALLLPFCFFATQKAFPHLPFFVFGLLLLAQYALLTALFACVIPFALGWVWKGKPLEDSTLRQRLHQLADKAGVAYRDIILLRTQSSKLANAWVAGILPQWRSVFLTDYLLEHLTLEEIETIFAHELGHIKHRHLLKQVAWIVLGFGGQSLLIHLSLLLFDSLPTLPPWLYWLLFVGVNLGAILLVVQLGLMRFWRGMEFEADAYAVALTQQPAVFLQALRKLIELNDAPEDLDTFNEMLSTHPNFTARAEAIENL